MIFTKDGYTHSVDTAYCLLDYVRSVLDSDLNYRVKELAVSATDYIAAAYAREGRANGELTALISDYLYLSNKPEAKPASPVADDMTALAFAIRGAQLNLETGMKMRFNLVGTYTGTVTVEGKAYSVTNGTVDGKSYIELSLPAHLMYSTVFEISADGVNASYSLEAYAYYVSDEATLLPEEEKALVSALYTYCYYASVYEYAANN